MGSGRDVGRVGTSGRDVGRGRVVTSIGVIHMRECGVYGYVHIVIN